VGSLSSQLVPKREALWLLWVSKSAKGSQSGLDPQIGRDERLESVSEGVEAVLRQMWVRAEGLCFAMAPRWAWRRCRRILT
jgi:hypothetical protein